MLRCKGRVVLPACDGEASIIHIQQTAILIRFRILDYITILVSCCFEHVFISACLSSLKSGEQNVSLYYVLKS